MPAPGRSLLLDGGDLWQGTGLANIMQGADMVEAANLLGIEAMTGHWEFTYGEETLRANLKSFKGEFLAQNVFLTEEAAFNDSRAFDPRQRPRVQAGDDQGGRRLPRRRDRPGVSLRADRASQALHAGLDLRHPRDGVAEAGRWSARATTRSMPSSCCRTTAWIVDLKLASRVTGIDVILGGHTHDAVPQPIPVDQCRRQDAGDQCRLERKIPRRARSRTRQGRSQGRALSPAAGLFRTAEAGRRDAEPDRQAAMRRTQAAFGEKLAAAGDLLYRRGNFNGTMDQLICDALRHELDAEIALSPGFRWGNSLLPGEAITMDDVLSETAITYPEVYVQDMTGAQIKAVMEDVCDNLFNPDPYYQQGGDMVRIGGMDYACTPAEPVGKRISDLTLDSGKTLEADKSYKVAGWASVNPQQGKPVWDVFADYLAPEKTAKPKKLNQVALKGCRTIRVFPARGRKCPRRLLA